MLTIDGLRAFGANVDEGMARCMNNEAFYIRLVKMAVEDTGFEKLSQALRDGDLTAAFEAAHALKGVLGNLALTPLFGPISEMTEQLRSRTEMDYSGAIAGVLEKREALRALCSD